MPSMTTMITTTTMITLPPFYYHWKKSNSSSSNNHWHYLILMAKNNNSVQPCMTKWKIERKGCILSSRTPCNIAIRYSFYSSWIIEIKKHKWRIKCFSFRKYKARREEWKCHQKCYFYLRQIPVLHWPVVYFIGSSNVEASEICNKVYIHPSCHIQARNWEKEKDLWRHFRVSLLVHGQYMFIFSRL